MQLFKYASAENALKLLSELRVRVSSADQLNDPFELSPKIDPAFFTIDKAIHFLRQDHQIDYWYEREARERGYSNKKAYKRWYLQRTNLRKRAEPLMKNIPQNVEQARQNFARTFSDGNGFKLFCASKRNDSVLMWSHYANNHQGIVLEFDSSKPPFSNLQSEYVMEVHYSEKKSPFNYVPEVEHFKRALLAVARTKSLDWKYEEEVRIIFPAALCFEGQFMRFNSQALRSVIFGCRCSQDNRTVVIKELAKSHFSHVQISEATLSSQEFRLEFKEIGR